MANVLDTAYEYGHFFLMNIKFHADNSREAMDLHSTIQKVEKMSSHSSKGFKVVHKFKVLGEPQILVGKSTEELLATWKNETTAALAARVYSGMELDLFKVVAQRKVHCFPSAACPEDVDKLSFELPVMKENGANVHIISKSLQLLENYVNM